MSAFSPSASEVKTEAFDIPVSGPSRSPDRNMTSGTSGLLWTQSGPMLRMENAVVETVTITTIPPIPLPRIPEPEIIARPDHLAPEVYPLANKPSPEDMRVFALTLGGQRVVVHEDNNATFGAPQTAEAQAGPGWTRTICDGGSSRSDDSGQVELLQALNRASKGKERKRPHDFSQVPSRGEPSSTALTGLNSNLMPTPPMGVETPVRPRRSPPRKKIRAIDESSLPHDGTGALLSPLPSPEHEAGPSTPSLQSSTRVARAQAPSVGSGIEMAALFSLPSLVSHFEILPDKLQQQILIHFLRRSRMPTIQRVSAFAGLALKRDFITQLPHEIAVQILKKVDIHSLASALRVSKKWRRMIDSERVVWRQRLIDDNLWTGLGVEEEEEATVVRRIQTLEWQMSQRGRHDKAGTPSENEPMSTGNLRVDRRYGLSEFEKPVPLKHVYRKRYTSARNWLHNNATHTTFAGHGTNVVTCLQFDEDKIISASDDHSINVYNTANGQLRRRLDGHEGGVWALQYKGDTMVSGSTDRTVRIWDLDTLTEAHVFHGHTSTVRCLQIIEPLLDEKTGEFYPAYPMLVTGSRDTTLRVWKLPRKGEQPLRPMVDATGTEIPISPNENPWHVHLLEGHTGAVRALAAQGRICVSGSYDCTVRVWDIVSGTLKHTLTGHDQKVYSVTYAWQRNQCASGSMDNTVKVWNVNTGECLHTLVGHTSLVGLLGSSPSFLVSAAADSSLRVWDSSTFELKHTLTTPGNNITCFRHDEDKVVSGSDGTLKLWDIKTGQYVRDLVIGISSVWQVAFNGSLLVSASSRGGTTVYDVFDFGATAHPSGMDDPSLDQLCRPAWERANPLEPQEYQVEDIAGMGIISPDPLFTASPTGSGSYRYRQGMDVSLSSPLRASASRRSSRLAARNHAPSGEGPSSYRMYMSSTDPPTRSRRGARFNHSADLLSPTPVGPPGPQGVNLLGQSFVPIFDDALGADDEDMMYTGPSFRQDLQEDADDIAMEVSDQVKEEDTV